MFWLWMSLAFVAGVAATIALICFLGRNIRFGPFM